MKKRIGFWGIMFFAATSLLLTSCKKNIDIVKTTWICEKNVTIDDENYFNTTIKLCFQTEKEGILLTMTTGMSSGEPMDDTYVLNDFTYTYNKEKMRGTMDVENDGEYRFFVYEDERLSLRNEAGNRWVFHLD